VTLKKQLILLTVVRALILLWLTSEGYSLFSDDGATRLLLSDEWAKDPFVSSQIPWLPLQFYLLGSLSLITGLKAYVLGLSLNFLLILLLPWIFVATLPDHFDEKQKSIALWIMGLWPWALWLGVSGLSEPLMWSLALGLYVCFKRKQRACFMICAVLLSMCRIEAWLWVGLLGLMWLMEDFKAGRKSQVLIMVLVLAAFPLFWLPQLDLAARVRIDDAAKDDASPMKLVLFFVVAFFTAPFWLLMLSSFWQSRKELFRQYHILAFVIIFYLSSVTVALATAVPQRNLVFPLLLLLPYFVAHSRWAWKVVLLFQFMVCLHPQELLRQETCQQRIEVAQVLEAIAIKGELKPEENIMVCLEDDPHRYLSLHLAHLTGLREQLYTDTQPHEHYDIATYPTGGKFIIYEYFPKLKSPLTNHWRSYHEGESLFSKRTDEEIRELLNENKVKILVTGRQDQPASNFGFVLYKHQDPFSYYIRRDETKRKHVLQERSEAQPSRKKALMKLFKEGPSVEVFEAFRKMLGL
jgi:hypothetical protein